MNIIVMEFSGVEASGITTIIVNLDRSETVTFNETAKRRERSSEELVKDCLYTASSVLERPPL